MQICNRLYFNKASKYLLLFLLLAFYTKVSSQNNTISTNEGLTNIMSDSLMPSSPDTLAKVNPTKQKSNQIDAEIKYSAKDSIVFLGNGTGFLHGESDVNYKNINLKADFVRVKLDSSLIYAHGTLDSIGRKVGEPVFKEGETEYESRELNYNLKTKKGFIRQAVTKQGEGYIISDKTKKTTADILCISGAKYTTCDNHDHPDFYMSLTKGKVKPGGYVVAGPSYLVLCDVPLPLAIPFGFFPFTDKYSSGILMPTFADELTRGFGLVNGGYYFAINDYMDMELRGDIYTKGTWALSVSSSYQKRYKFGGNFNLSYREDVTGEKDMADYNKANNLSIRWSHTQNQKANPYFNFSSSVNFSTSGYNRSNINSYYDGNLNAENTKSSSVSFSQRFPDSPFSLSGNVQINQRTKDSTISLTLPNISISMSRIYPFKRKVAVGNERWYEKITMSYSGTIDNNINTKEKLLLSSSLTRDWKNGMRHSIPISASFNLLKYINVSPSVNYTERWYLQSYNEKWDDTSKRVLKDTTSGFYRVYDFNIGVSASTKLYGFYIPIRSIFGDKIDRIRHVLTPQIGFSYMPDFGDSMWGYYGEYAKTVEDKSNLITGTRTEYVRYSHFAGSLYGTPGVGKSGNINFSLGNNIEMKVRNDKDTTGTEPFIKVSLIDNFSISGGYNLAADSLQWAPFSTNLRLKFGKINPNISAVFEPYLYGSNGQRINKLRWNNGKFPMFAGSLGFPLSYTLNNDTFKKKTKKDANNGENTQQKINEVGEVPTGESATDQPTKDAENNKNLMLDAGYQKLTIPWSISANYNISYNRVKFNQDRLEYDYGFTHSLSFSGNIDLTVNWKMNATTTYDFTAKQFTYTNMNITRSLHCWTMTASVVPFGPYKSYNFHLGVNASMLKDLKYDKRSGYEKNNITWY